MSVVFLGSSTAFAQLTPASQWSSATSDETLQTAWGDHDSDGDLDLLLCSLRAPLRLLRNDAGTLLEIWTSTDAEDCHAAAWGDYDGDGDLDLAIGNANAQPNRLYQNDGGTLTSVWTSAEADDTRDVAWGDYDGDGDLDLAVGNVGAPNRLYRNDSGSLVLVWSAAAADGTERVAWGDYDGDGDLDLGVGNLGSANQIYRNDTGTLSLAWTATEIDLTIGLAWADVDGDGDLDLATGNRDQPNRLYRNDAGSMVLVWSSVETDATHEIAWADWDGDGDPDLAVANNGQPNRVYQNDAGTLTAAWASVEVGPSYGLSWGDVDGDGDPDLAVANRGAASRIYRNEGARLVLNWTSVESYSTQDHAWGDFDGDGDLDVALANVNSPEVVYQNDGGTMTIAWVSPAPVTSAKSCVAWGDYDGDSDLDLVVGGDAGKLTVFRNDGGSPVNLTEAWSVPVSDTISVAWGDFDGDGDLDLAAGDNGWPSGAAVKLYRNDGGAPVVLTNVWASAETSGTNSIAWGDYDNDNDLDLVVGTNKLGAARDRLYRNDGGDPPVFTLAWNRPELDYTWDVKWADYDGDGDLDLAFAGGDSGVEPSARIYRNDGGAPAVFTLVWSSPFVDHGVRLSWGDWDGDGDFDLALTSAEGSERIRVLRNQGGTFDVAWAYSAGAGVVAWCDWDGDGDLDLAVGQGNVVIYRNGRIDRRPDLAESSVFAVAAQRPGSTKSALFYSTPEVLGSPVMISYTLVDAEGDLAWRIIPEYSMQGGGQWFPATQGTGGDGTTRLTASAGGTGHTFSWDAASDAVRSDNVVVRLTVVWQAPDRCGYPIQAARIATTTPAFRVRADSTCAVGNLGPITELKGVKDGLGGAEFSWLADAGASEHHLNSVTAATDLVPPGPHRPPLAGARAQAQCEAFAPPTRCSDMDAITDPNPLLFYQVFAACGSDGLTEGP